MCTKTVYVWVERGGRAVKQPVPCRKCWQCRRDRVTDYVGRCLAEAEYCDWSLTLTLTYKTTNNNTHERLDKTHFQDFIRSLRKRGHKLRYVVAGEYGSLNSRAHFHVVLFGVGQQIETYDNPDLKGEAQLIPQQERCWHESWPWGHMYADHGADEKAFRYTLKYLDKDHEKDHWFSLSKKPALGSRFFAELAEQTIATGLPPVDFYYWPPGSDRLQKARYRLTGATRRDYLKRVALGLGMQGFQHVDRLTSMSNEWIKKAFWKVCKHDVEQYKPDLVVESAEFEKMVEAMRPDECLVNYEIRATDFIIAHGEHPGKEVDTFRKAIKDGSKIPQISEEARELLEFEDELDAAAHAASARIQYERRAARESRKKPSQARASPYDGRTA